MQQCSETKKIVCYGLLITIILHKQREKKLTRYGESQNVPIAVVAVLL
jgi:hypothetical protein